MPRIVITPLSEVESAMRAHTPSHLVTLLSPAYMIETPSGFDVSRHLKLSMNDIADIKEGEAPPTARHVESLLQFGRGWDANAPLLVHCWADISRSTAAAYIISCDRLGAGEERAIAQMLRHRAPHAYPNRLMIRLADMVLGRDGRMIDAIESIGRGKIVSEGYAVEMSLALDTP